MTHLGTKLIHVLDDAKGARDRIRLQKVRVELLRGEWRKRGGRNARDKLAQRRHECHGYHTCVVLPRKNWPGCRNALGTTHPLTLRTAPELPLAEIVHASGRWFAPGQ